jgi:hypothetical protein
MNAVRLDTGNLTSSVIVQLLVFPLFTNDRRAFKGTYLPLATRGPI